MKMNSNKIKIEPLYAADDYSNILVNSNVLVDLGKVKSNCNFRCWVRKINKKYVVAISDKEFDEHYDDGY